MERAASLGPAVRSQCQLSSSSSTLMRLLQAGCLRPHATCKCWPTVRPSAAAAWYRRPKWGAAIWQHDRAAAAQVLQRRQPPRHPRSSSTSGMHSGSCGRRRTRGRLRVPSRPSTRSRAAKHPCSPSTCRRSSDPPSLRRRPRRICVHPCTRDPPCRPPWRLQWGRWARPWHVAASRTRCPPSCTALPSTQHPWGQQLGAVGWLGLPISRRLHLGCWHGPRQPRDPPHPSSAPCLPDSLPLGRRSLRISSPCGSLYSSSSLQRRGPSTGVLQLACQPRHQRPSSSRLCSCRSREESRGVQGLAE